MCVYSTSVDPLGNTGTRKVPQDRAQERRESQKEAGGSTVMMSVWGVHLTSPEETNPSHLSIVRPSVGAPKGFTQLRSCVLHQEDFPRVGHRRDAWDQFLLFSHMRGCSASLELGKSTRPRDSI